MNSYIRSQKGITLVALVITIILLILLAGIAISLVIGQNGMITKAKEAKIIHRRGAAREKIEIILEEYSMKKNLDEENNLFIFLNKKVAEGKLDSVKDNGNGTLDVTVDEYTMTVNEDKLKVIDETKTELKESEIKISQSPTAWTNGNVTVTISTILKDYTLQYKIGSGSWATYTKALIISKNETVIYARLTDGINYGTTSTHEVTNIDTTAPTTIAPSLTSTSSTVTATSNQTDAESGISSTQYAIKLSSSSTWANWQASENFTGLIQNTSYDVKTKATDIAGNSRESLVTSITTGEVPALTSNNITFMASPTEVISENVIVTISKTAPTEYILQYSIGNTTNWNNYTKELTITENTIIYARLWDGTNGGTYTTFEVSNIDRIEPNKKAPTVQKTSRSITVINQQEDKESGISSVQYSIKEKTAITWQNWQNDNKFDRLTQNTDYIVRTKTTDKAKNSSISEELDVKTDTVPELLSYNVSFSCSPSGWTAGNVVVNFSTSTYAPDCSLEYSIGNATNWNKYYGNVLITENTDVNIRFTDGINVGKYATKSVSNIDKKPPTVGTPVVTSQGTNNIYVSTYAQDSLSGLWKIEWTTRKSNMYGSLGPSTTTYYSSPKSNNPVSTSISGTFQKGQVYVVYLKVYDAIGNNVTSNATTFTKN